MASLAVRDRAAHRTQQDERQEPGDRRSTYPGGGVLALYTYPSNAAL